MIKDYKSLLYSLVTDKRKDFIFLPIKFILRILSFIYVFGLKLIIRMYHWGIFKSYRLDCKVISVGNITLGGVGKTPLVEMLVKKLKSMGVKPAVLIRGYKGKIQGVNIDSWGKFGDETIVLNENISGIPILVGKDRIKYGKLAIKNFGVNCLILDDGFQYIKLKRDLDIVVVDSTNPFGNKKLLPRGILREPVSNLKRAHIYILTKANMGRNNIEKLTNLLNKINPDAEILESIHKPLCFYTIKDKKKLPLTFISGEKICALSGIGNPYYFEWMLERLKAKVDIIYRFPDHHYYTHHQLNKVFSECKDKNIKVVVTTQKDKVRMPNIKNYDFLDLIYLSVEFEILKGKDLLNEKLYNLFLS